MYNRGYDETQNTRSIDKKAEENLGKFIDKYFYPKLISKNPDNVIVDRITDKKSQVAGIDVNIQLIYENNDRQLFPIDEKASMKYRNQNLGTYAFEISSSDINGKQYDGWFMNDELATYAYMLMWPSVRTVSFNGGREEPLAIKDINCAEDFTSVDCMFINKTVLWKELERQGITKEFLMDKAEMMRDFNQKYCEVNNNMHLSCSINTREKSAVLVINRDLLRSVCDWTPFTVTQEQLIEKDLFNDKKFKKTHNRQRCNSQERSKNNSQVHTHPQKKEQKCYTLPYSAI